MTKVIARFVWITQLFVGCAQSDMLLMVLLMADLVASLTPNQLPQTAVSAFRVIPTDSLELRSLALLP